MKISILVLLSFVACLQVAYSDDNCYTNLSTPPNTNTVITNEQSINCTDASIFWNYPTNNLTIIFSSSQHTSFEFCLIESNQIYKNIPVYRVVGEKETLVIKSENKVCMPSESQTNVLTLKLVGPQRMMYYGVFIQYSIN
jgi:hypothetical protein